MNTLEEYMNKVIVTPEELQQRKQMEKASKDLSADMSKGRSLAKEVLGKDGLGRIKEDSDVNMATTLLRKATEGPSSEASQIKRESAVSNLNKAQQSNLRTLQSSLASSGVKGGAAGAQLARLTANGINERRGLERDLFLDQSNQQTQAVKDFANIASANATFDLSQASKEKNIELQSRLGFAELGSAERSNIRMSSAAEKAAVASSSGGGGKW